MYVFVCVCVDYKKGHVRCKLARPGVVGHALACLGIHIHVYVLFAGSCSVNLLCNVVSLLEQEVFQHLMSRYMYPVSMNSICL